MSYNIENLLKRAFRIEWCIHFEKSMLQLSKSCQYSLRDFEVLIQASDLESQKWFPTSIFVDHLSNLSMLNISRNFRISLEFP